jgi:hypothetical protein
MELVCVCGEGGGGVEWHGAPLKARGTARNEKGVCQASTSLAGWGMECQLLVYTPLHGPTC